MTEALLYFPGMQTIAVLTEKKKVQKERKKEEKEISIYLTADKSFADTTFEARLWSWGPYLQLNYPHRSPSLPGLDNRDSKQESQRSTHLGNYLMGDFSYCLHVGITKEKNPTASQTA